MLSSLVPLLAGSPLFSALTNSELESLLNDGRLRSFDRNEVVVHEGDLGDTLHLIVDGCFSARATTRRGDVVTLAIFGPGQFFGEIALVRADRRRIATVVSLERGATVAIPSGSLARLRERRPEVSQALLEILAAKVERYTQRLLEALYVPAELRVVARLLELAEVYQGRGWLPVTQVQVSHLAGTSRATVNRVLRDEEARGTIEIARGRLLICDPISLERRLMPDRLPRTGSSQEGDGS